MSFISSLFSKKPGGTAVGNFLRGIANTATGGLLGTGRNVIPVTGQAAAYYPGYTPALPTSYIPNVLRNQLAIEAAAVGDSAVTIWLKANWIKLVAVVAALFAGIYFITKRKRYGR